MAVLMTSRLRLQLVKHRGSGGGGGRKVAVLDLYMSDPLHTQDWGRVRGATSMGNSPD